MYYTLSKTYSIKVAFREATVACAMALTSQRGWITSRTLELDYNVHQRGGGGGGGGVVSSNTLLMSVAQYKQAIIALTLFSSFVLAHDVPGYP